jgi:hypothetical protein
MRPASGQDLIARIASSAAELNATRERVLGVLREQVRVPVEEMLRCSAAFSASAGASVPEEMARFAEAARHLLLILDTTNAGIICTKKFAYDLWGDTVNTASRMESHGSPGQIQVSDSTYNRLRGGFRLSPRGQIEVKGKGSMTTCLLEER